jgi:hypothetical protein
VLFHRKGIYTLDLNVQGAGGVVLALKRWLPTQFGEEGEWEAWSDDEAVLVMNVIEKVGFLLTGFPRLRADGSSLAHSVGGNISGRIAIMSELDQEDSSSHRNATQQLSFEWSRQGGRAPVRRWWICRCVYRQICWE